MANSWKHCRKEIVTRNLPFTTFSMPSEYCSSRPDDFFRPMEQIDLAPLSVRSQEMHLVKDLLMVYMALQGNSIRFVRDGDEVIWTVNPSADVCLRSALYEDACLPLAASFINLRHKIKDICCNISRGRVVLAVGNATEEFYNTEIMPLLVKLDSESRKDSRALTIAEVATYMRPYMLIIKHLNDVLSTIIKEELIGGEVLTMLAQLLRNCVSPAASDVIRKLEEIGLAEYFELLFWWARYGIIQDQCYEFMIWDIKMTRPYTKSDILRGTDVILGDDCLDSFDDQICVVKALCPSQLHSVSDDIVKCGIYLRIIERINATKNPTLKDAWIGNENELSNWRHKKVEDVLREIKEVRRKTSGDLVQLLRKKFNLEDYFESFYNFLLLQRSDWLMSFTEISRSMLSNSVREVSVKKLQILFEEAVDSSTLHSDKHRHIFKPVLEKYDLFTSLQLIDGAVKTKGGSLSDSESMESKSGLDAFSIQVTVNSPISLVFPPKILLFYSLIFRMQFYLHDATTQISCKLTDRKLIAMRDRRLLTDMFHFLNAYNSHCSMNVICPLWDDFMAKLSDSGSLEQILSCQDSFFANAMAQCFLPDVNFMNLLADLVTIIRDFTAGKYDCDESTKRWEESISKMRSFLSMNNNNNAYAHLHSRIFSLVY